MSECKHDFFTVQSEDSRCMNCGETESSIQSWRYVRRIAELEAELRKTDTLEWMPFSEYKAIEAVNKQRLKHMQFMEGVMKETGDLLDKQVAENKALREQFSRDMDFANKSYGDLKTENKALREAAQAVVEWSADNFDIDHCKEFHVLAALTKEEL